MRPISKKQSSINRKLHAVYSEIAQEREPVCAGCGRGDMPLSNSHTVSQKRCKYLRKPELISDKDNIELECFTDSNSCHQKWESGNYEKIKDMLNFEKRMEYLRHNDEQAYLKIKMQMPVDK